MPLPHEACTKDEKSKSLFSHLIINIYDFNSSTIPLCSHNPLLTQFIKPAFFITQMFFLLQLLILFHSKHVVGLSKVWATPSQGGQDKIMQMLYMVSMYSACICFFFLILFVRLRDSESQSASICWFTSSKACNSHSCTRQKLGARTAIQVSLVDSWNPVT